MAEEERNTRRGRPSGDFAFFSRHTLLEAIKLAQAIQDNNAGRPYSRLSIAEALSQSPESSKFRNLITSSGRYGLTEGSAKAEKIAMTDIGLSITAPRTPEERNTGLRKALMTPPLF